MHYRVTVSHKGQHYFTTAENSFYNYDDAMNAARHFEQLFTVADGYAISVYYVETTHECLTSNRHSTLGEI